MNMKYVALMFAALCLVALPFSGSLQMAEAQEESALSRVLGGDVGAMGDVLTEMLPVIPELIQWVIGVIAVALEGILAFVEVIVSFCLSPSGIPLFVQLTVQAVFGAVGYGILGFLVGLLFPVPLVGWVCTAPVGAILGGLLGLFGQGEVPEGMTVDLDEIKGWADINPLENLQ